MPAGTAGLVNLVPVKTVTKTVTPFGTFETTCDVTGGTDVVASYTAKQPPADPTLVASPGSVEQNSQLGLSGTKWEGNVTTVSLCDAGGANCQALPAQLYSLNVANGNLTGGVQIVDQVPPGTYTVKVESDAPQSKTSNSFTVTGVPPVTASASPSSGDLGQATVVSGDNWVKSGNVTLQGQKSDGTATTDAPVTVATDANGHFSSPYTVNDKNTAKINVSGGGKSANAAYTPKFGQQLGQDASGTVNSGGLSFQQAAAGIQLLADHAERQAADDDRCAEPGCGPGLPRRRPRLGPDRSDHRLHQPGEGRCHPGELVLLEACLRGDEPGFAEPGRDRFRGQRRPAVQAERERSGRRVRW
ncbi:hypothetical protein ACU686_07435 [Yinghuangia aomiensis]